jgi:hypothetical protein
MTSRKHAGARGLLAVLLLLGCGMAEATAWGWPTGIDGTKIADALDVAVAVAIDPNGGIVAAGHLRHVNTSVDFAVVKFDSGGTKLWAETIRGSQILGPRGSRLKCGDSCRGARAGVDPETGRPSRASTSKRGTAARDDISLARAARLHARGGLLVVGNGRDPSSPPIGRCSRWRSSWRRAAPHLIIAKKRSRSFFRVSWRARYSYSISTSAASRRTVTVLRTSTSRA